MVASGTAFSWSIVVAQHNAVLRETSIHVNTTSGKLTDGENQVVGVERLDGGEVGRNDLELVSIETDMEIVVDADVHQAQQVGLSRS